MFHLDLTVSLLILFNPSSPGGEFIQQRMMQKSYGQK